MARVRQLERVVAGVWLAAIVVAFSDAGVSFPVWMVLFVSMLALAVWAIVRMAVSVASAAGRAEPWRSRLAVPAVLAAGLALASTNGLLMIRLCLSEGALLASVPSLEADPPRRFARTRRAGLFRVEEFSRFGRELRFLTGSCGLVDACGVVYAPEGQPPNRGEDSFSHLYGPWWHWYQSW